jgi:chloramphenicol-sensitive protein RarD
VSDSAHSRSSTSQGAVSAAVSFLLWGIFPIYWKQLHGIPAFELIAHRIVWSLLFLLVVQLVQKSFGELRPIFSDGRIFGLSLLSSALLAANWTIYVWAVNAGHIIETSLGYFLTPLCNVAVGRLAFGERLRVLQWLAIALAALGVWLLLVPVGAVPWIALSLAGTWTGYGVMKKKSALGPVAGLTGETLLLLPVAAALLLWRVHTGEGALGHVDLVRHILILSIGTITSVPLLLFAHGARRIRMTTLGLLQYIAPTVQFFIGLLVYREPFDSAQLQAFVLIWCGLALYSSDSFWAQRRLLLKAAGVA